MGIFIAIAILLFFVLIVPLRINRPVMIGPSGVLTFFFLYFAVVAVLFTLLARGF